MRFLLAAAVALVVAAGAQTASAQGAGAAPASGAPELPAGYRRKAAAAIALEYMRDATGPAEIAAAPARGNAIFGGGWTEVIVRYPVRKHSWVQELTTPVAMLHRVEKTEPAMRCITVTAGRGKAGGEVRFTVSRRRRDPSSCGDGQAFRPYPELEQIAARLRECVKKRQERCVVAANAADREGHKPTVRR